MSTVVKWVVKVGFTLGTIWLEAKMIDKVLGKYIEDRPQQETDAKPAYVVNEQESTDRVK